MRRTSTESGRPGRPGLAVRWGLIGAATVLTVPLLAACGSPDSGTVLSFYTAADGAEQYAEAAANCTAAAGGRYTIEQRTLPKGQTISDCSWPGASPETTPRSTS